MEINPRDIAAQALSPQLATSSAIITKSVQKGAEMESAVRVADSNKGQNVDVTV